MTPKTSSSVRSTAATAHSDAQEGDAAQCAEGVRERKKRRSREAMHRAALELVAEHGLAGVTAEQIAERAGVSTRTLFNHWGSKEAVVLGIAPDAAHVLVDLLEARPLEEEPAASMRVLLREHLRCATPDRSLRTLKRTVLRREPQLAQITVNYMNDVQRSLVDALAARLKRTGSAQPLVEAALYVMGMFALSRASYVISMDNDCDLLDALDIALDTLSSGAVSLMLTRPDDH